MRLLPSITFFGLLGLALCPASVTLNVSAATLQDANGQAMPTSGRVLLVVSTNDATIAEPTAQSFVSGDDQIIFSGNLSSSGFAGVFSSSVQVLDLSGGVSPGDPIALFWFPTLDANASSPGAGTPYGRYAPSSGEEQDGSAPWVLPGDGSLVSLNMVTQSQGGSLPNSAGLASLTTPGGSGGDNGGGDNGGGVVNDYLTPGSSELGGGWYFGWIGTFNPGGWPWVIQSEFGWMYAGVSGNSNAGSWFYMSHPELQCWLWSSETTRPWVFCEPVGQTNGWWFIDTEAEEGFFYLFKQDGSAFVRAANAL